MSLRTFPGSPIPEDTVRVARAAFPKGNRYMQMHDALGSIYSDGQFAGLFSQTGQSAEAPARLALVLVLQFAEGLSDRQAADAVRGRIDWKYALALELTDPGSLNLSLRHEVARLIVWQVIWTRPVVPSAVSYADVREGNDPYRACGHGTHSHPTGT